MNEDRYSSLDEDEYRQAYEAAGCNRNLIRFHQCCEKWHKPQCQRKLDIVLFIMMCFCFCLLFLGPLELELSNPSFNTESKKSMI